MSLLMTMSPAAIDAEIRGLSPDNGGSLEWLQRFMQFLLRQLKTNMNFELVESYLGLFLKVCSEEIKCKKYSAVLRSNYVPLAISCRKPVLLLPSLPVSLCCCELPHPSDVPTGAAAGCPHHHLGPSPV